MLRRRMLKKWFYGRCPGIAGSFPYFGVRVYFPKGSLSFEGACEQGIWESELIQIINKLILRDTFYFDVGANIGLTSVPILSARQDCCVVSFEASPNVLPFLQQTRDLSRYGDRWRIVSKALAAEVGVAPFYVASSELSLFDGLRDTMRAGPTRQVTVPTTTLDVEWERLGRPSVSLIKMDIEGGEMQALAGAALCIDRERPSIVLEWNSTNLRSYACEPDTLLKFASDHRYQVLSLPNLIRVTDPMMLYFQMIRTESFLLAPCGAATAPVI